MDLHYFVESSGSVAPNKGDKAICGFVATMTYMTLEQATLQRQRCPECVRLLAITSSENEDEDLEER